MVQHQGEYKQARQLYQKSLQIFERLGDQSGRATTLHALGVIAQDQGDYPQASQLYEESLQIYERLGDQRGRATTLHALGVIAQQQGDYPQARQLYEENLQIFERLGDQSGRASSLHQLGMIAQQQGDYPEARQLYEESLQIKERLGDQSGRATTLHALGVIAQQQGDYPQARQLYQESLQIFERLGDQSGRAGTLHQLGVIAQDQGDYPEARQLYQESLQIKERLGDQSGRATTLHALGVIAQQQGDYPQARQLYEESLQIKERLGDQSGRANSLGQLWTLAYEQEDFEGALRYTASAYLLFEALHSPALVLAQRMIGRIRSHLDDATFTANWHALVGDRPVPILPSEDPRQALLTAVIDFIRTPTWQASQRFLEGHPELLQPEIDAMLQELATQQEHEGASQSIEAHRLLLARCREVGVDAAFDDLQVEQSPGDSFTTELNALCNEVVVALRAGKSEEQNELAARLEERLKADLPMDGVQDFLMVLVAWLCGKLTQDLLEKLQSPFDDTYAHMVAVVEQQEADSPDEGKASSLTVEELQHVVSSMILQGTDEQRQQFAEGLIE